MCIYMLYMYMYIYIYMNNTYVYIYASTSPSLHRRAQSERNARFAARSYLPCYESREVMSLTHSDSRTSPMRKRSQL